MIFYIICYRCRTRQQVVCQSGGLTLWRMNGMKFKRVVRRISCSTSSHPCFYWVLLASAAGRRPTHTTTISLTTRTSTVHRWAACWDLLWLDLSTCSQVRHWLIRSVYLLTGETSVDWISLPSHRWDIDWLDQSTCSQVRHWLIGSVYLLTGETSVNWISLTSHWLIVFLLHNAMLSIAQTMLSQDVHLHDTHQYYVETAKHIIKLFSPSNSHIILVFLYQALWQYSDGDPLKGSLNAGGVWKNVIFDHCLALSWNDTRYVYSYCRVWIGSCTVPKLLNGTIFHWTWTTPNPHFKVMPLFDVEYRKYCCHSCC